MHKTRIELKMIRTTLETNHGPRMWLDKARERECEQQRNSNKWN